MTFESGPSKGVNVLAIFGYVVKIEVFSEGETRKKNSVLPGLFFERLTFLSKIENRLKRGGKVCVRISQKETSWIFKKCLDDGNLLFLAFLFSVALRPYLFKPKIKILIIFKTFLECVGKV